MIVGDQFFAQLNSMTAVMKSTSVCLAPVSADAKSTTSESDVTSRWLAAQEVFNSTKNMNLLTKYFAIMKDLTFVIDGNSYKGFTVGYADGTGETWAINPAYATSTIKLLDHPMPGSLSPYQGKSHRPKCNAG